MNRMTFHTGNDWACCDNSVVDARWDCYTNKKKTESDRQPFQIYLIILQCHRASVLGANRNLPTLFQHVLKRRVIL